MFYKRLCLLCEKNNCKPNTITKALGLSSATATKWKNDTIPNGETLVNIADYLDCSVDYLLGRTDNPEINDEPVINREEIVERFDELSSRSQKELMKYLNKLTLEQIQEDNNKYSVKKSKNDANIIL